MFGQTRILFGRVYLKIILPVEVLTWVSVRAPTSGSTRKPFSRYPQIIFVVPLVGTRKLVHQFFIQFSSLKVAGGPRFLSGALILINVQNLFSGQIDL